MFIFLLCGGRFRQRAVLSQRVQRRHERVALAAFWAAVVDALPVHGGKDLVTTQILLANLARDDVLGGSTAVAAETARAALEAAGAANLPLWTTAAEGGAAPEPPADDDDSSLFSRGWQGHASSFLETSFLERVVRPA